MILVPIIARIFVHLTKVSSFVRVQMFYVKRLGPFRAKPLNTISGQISEITAVKTSSAFLILAFDLLAFKFISIFSILSIESTINFSVCAKVSVISMSYPNEMPTLYYKDIKNFMYEN